jgi:hypothetical protein
MEAEPRIELGVPVESIGSQNLSAGGLIWNAVKPYKQ